LSYDTRRVTYIVLMRSALPRDNVSVKLSQRRRNVAVTLEQR
jgi:hypothetical protein